MDVGQARLVAIAAREAARALESLAEAERAEWA